ncbi:MAG: PhnD/SsuA/transferrin family substrate-binding protein [Planctomycetes bacterium]|nr:PhnD/SsuA/transferrin family substrate-binding protein [Planctomycetota bacterium]
MKTISKQIFGLFLLAVSVVSILYAIGLLSSRTTQQRDATADVDNLPLRIVVMDPLSDQLACDCVEGYAQRKYNELAAFLEKQLGRPVELAYGENLPDILTLNPGKVDLLIGKESIVLFDAAETKLSIHPIARLTDKSGTTNLSGLFVVRRNDPANSVEDLKGYKILFGPEYDTEKSTAAIAALKTKGVPIPKQIKTKSSCNQAVVAVMEKEADAAVISSFNLALLEGCSTIDKGILRVVGRTSAVPFITVFATDAVSLENEKLIVEALLAVGKNKRLLAQMESKTGFVNVRRHRSETTNPDTSRPVVEWTDWRGPRRDALSGYVPKKLSAKPKFLWRQPMTGMGLSGIAATTRYVIVADKSKEKKLDIFRCLDAETGEQFWAIEYPAPEDMDFSNSPRANPVIHEGLVYLLGAFGDLHCVNLKTGQVLWKKNIVKEFGAELVTWGMCSAPLIVGDRLIVNPGAKDASIVALDRLTGKVIWKTPGEQAGYSSFILAAFGNVRQIVGYDSISLGGWDPKTGKRLWKLLPDDEGDFNVPTPIYIDGKLLVTTENNGTRLYGFDSNGKILSKPLAQNFDLGPDTSTPVVINNLVFGCLGGLFCLDLNNGLKTLYSVDDDAFFDYATLIAGNDHVLIITVEGELILIEAAGYRYTLKSRLRLFEKSEVFSHPALVGNRLYIRNTTEACCLLLDN